MAERQVSDFEIANGGFRKQAVPLIDSENEHKRIELVRAAVDLTKEATRAISITALETIREGAIFMGVIGSRGELLNPFRYIDAPIWKESEVPPSYD